MRKYLVALALILSIPVVVVADGSNIRKVNSHLKVNFLNLKKPMRQQCLLYITGWA